MEEVLIKPHDVIPESPTVRFQPCLLHLIYHVISSSTNPQSCTLHTGVSFSQKDPDDVHSVTRILSNAVSTLLPWHSSLFSRRTEQRHPIDEMVRLVGVSFDPFSVQILWILLFVSSLWPERFLSFRIKDPFVEDICVVLRIKITVRIYWHALCFQLLSWNP